MLSGVCVTSRFPMMEAETAESDREQLRVTLLVSPSITTPGDVCKLSTEPLVKRIHWKNHRTVN